MTNSVKTELQFGVVNLYSINTMTKSIRKSGGLDHVVSMPFRVGASVAFTDAAGFSVTELDLTLSNLGTRAVAVGSAFEFFRIKKLRGYTRWTGAGVTDLWNGTTNYVRGLRAGTQGVAFVESNAPLTGTPTTTPQMLQFEKVKLGGPYERLSLTISAAELAANPYKWYNCASTGASTDALSPGIWFVSADNAVAVDNAQTGVGLVIEGVLEFRGMITPALSLSSPAPLPCKTPYILREEKDSVTEYELVRVPTTRKVHN